MAAIEAVIFDWGNTLVDYPLQTTTEQITWLGAFLRRVAGQFGGQLRRELEILAGSEPALLRFNQELPDHAVRAFEKRLRESLALDFSTHIAGVVERQLCECLFASARAVEGASTVLPELCRMGLRIGIVSNTPWGTMAEKWRRELDHYDFVKPNCAAVVFCQDVGFRKPHPAAFLACLHRLQSIPDRTLVIGDSPASDMAGARAAGCPSVWFSRVVPRKSTSEQPAITHLSDLLQVIPANHRYV